MTTENSATHLALCSPVQGARMENLHKQWHSCAGEMTCSSLCAVRPMRVGETGKRGAQANCPASFGKSAAATATSYTGLIPSTNQGITSASRPETVSVLLRPVRPRKSVGPTGAEPQGGRCPNPRYCLGSSRPRTYPRDPSYRLCCHWVMLISMHPGSRSLFAAVW